MNQIPKTLILGLKERMHLHPSNHMQPPFIPNHGSLSSPRFSHE